MYVQVESDKYEKLLINEEAYKQGLSMLRDLLPNKDEIEEISKWDKEQLEGLFEEVDYTIRSIEDEVR